MPIFEDLLHKSRDASGMVTWEMITNLILSTLESRVGKQAVAWALSFVCDWKATAKCFEYL